MSGYGYLISNTQRPYWKKVTAKTLTELKGVPNKCQFCGIEEGLTIDHILPKFSNPKARGYLANYRLLCYSCNEGRTKKKKL